MTDVKRLTSAAAASFEQMKPMVKAHAAAIKRIAGHLGSGIEYFGDEVRCPLNMLKLAAEVHVQNLAEGTPQCSIETNDKEYRAAGNAMQWIINEWLVKADAAAAVKSAVWSSLFSMGILKCGRTVVGRSAIVDPITGIEDFLMLTEPFIEPVLIEDFVCDMGAKSIGQWGYVGHRYSVPFRELEEKTTDPALLERYRNAMDSRTYGQSANREQRITGGDEYDLCHEDKVTFWEITVPATREVFTFVGRLDGDPVSVGRWDGWHRHPYQVLDYNPIEGNAVSMPPLTDLVPLHDAVNRNLRKIIADLDRIKAVHLSHGSGLDAVAVEGAEDGATIPSNNSSAGITRFQIGGVPPERASGFEMLKSLLSYAGGNVDLLAGLSPQSETASQDKLLSGNATGQMRQKQNRVREFLGGVLRELAYQLWIDPVAVYEAWVTPPGWPLGKLRARLEPQQRGHDLFTHQITVAPYSLISRTPGERAALVQQLLQTTLLPLQQMMAQQGLAIDWASILKIIVTGHDVPGLDQIIITASGDDLGSVDSNFSPPKDRTYKHTYAGNQGKMDGTDSASAKLATASAEQHYDS